MAIIPVTTTADSGPGSLRAAVEAAQPGSTIQFAPSLANQTITTLSQIQVDKSLTFDGAGAPGLTISHGGTRTDRIFNLPTQGVSVAFKNLTFTNGNLPTDLGAAIHTTTDVNLTLENCRFANNVSRGGAVFVRDRSTLTVTNCRFDNNDGTAGDSLEISSGAIGTLRKCNVVIRGSQFTNNRGINGGAIFSVFSNLTVEDSLFRGNDSTAGSPFSNPGDGANFGRGGAIYIDGASISNNPRFVPADLLPGDPVGGKIIVRNTVVDGNRAAGEGGGLYLFGYPQDQVIVENSTISNNVVIADVEGTGRGGGLRAGPTQLSVSSTTFFNNAAAVQGGGLWYTGESPVTLSNTTFSGNRALSPQSEGGAIYSAQWALFTNILNSTFVSNSAGTGGAIFQSNKPLTVKNSLFHSNQARSGTRHVNRQLDEGGGNFQSPGGPDDLKVTASTRVTSLNLGPLRNNGGGLLTHALLTGSPAINAALPGAPDTDSWGYRRNGRADSGAFEFGGTPPTVPGPAPIPPIAGTGAADNLVGTAGNDTILASFGDDWLTGGLGADTLAGEEGADRFLYRGASQRNAFVQSRLGAMDQITDFDSGAGDRIQLDSDSNLATANLPRGLFNAGQVRGPNLLNSVKAAYSDKTPQNRGRQALRANEAVLLEWRGGLYLAVNDAQAGYNVSRDLLIDLTGMAPLTQQSSGTLAVADLFV